MLVSMDPSISDFYHSYNTLFACFAAAQCLLTALFGNANCNDDGPLSGESGSGANAGRSLFMTQSGHEPAPELMLPRRRFLFCLETCAFDDLLPH
jgi:hypothetical protein